MAFIKVTFQTSFNTKYEYVFNSDITIIQVKETLKECGLEKCHLIKNNIELIDGTLNTNNIKDGDIINLVINMCTGRNIVEQRIQYAQYEKFTESIKEIQHIYDELVLDAQDMTKDEQKERSPLEQLGKIQYERGISEDDYERDDMRLLFQRCRNQIEDEAKKIEQKKKEDENIKRKLEDLKNKMHKRKRTNNKIPKLTNDETSVNKNDNIQNKKETFCGFKKGFLLK